MTTTPEDPATDAAKATDKAKATDEAKATDKATPPSPKAKAKTSKTKTVRLAQTIQLKTQRGVELFQAGTVYEVGAKQGQIHPRYLEAQPLLDLSCDANVNSVTKRRELLAKIKKQHQTAGHVADKLAKGIGGRRRHGIL